MSENPDADLLRLFWVEVSEYLQTLNTSLLQIETAAAKDDEAMLREMNRVAHSMKGAARAVGISVIETIAHYMEDIFDGAMHKRLELKPDVCDLLYDGLDLIQNVVDGEENNTEALGEVLARLEQIIASIDSKAKPAAKPVPPPQPPAPASPQPVKPTTKRTTANPVVLTPPETGETLVLRAAEDTIRVTVSKLDTLMGEASELLVARMHAEERQREINHLRKLHSQWQHEWRAIRAAYIRLARRVTDQPDEATPELAVLFKFLESNQRYLAESNRQLAQLTQAVTQDNMRLSALAEQLQDDIGGMRLVPFDTIVPGFQRMIRDLGRDLGKKAQLDIGGANIELDKTVLEALKDPIMHLLRNAVDHGVEMPDERERLDKPPAGHIGLTIEQHGGEIMVQVSDDGRGINPTHVRRAVVRSGLLSTQEAAILSDEEVRSYIFYAGLTTSDSVTSLSGRGIGMDIVRDRVESLRGRVSVSSTVNQGTTVTLTVPVSLTRIRCILLQVGDQDFAVPSVVVSRMLTLKPEDVFTAEGREMALINERPTPIVPLHSVLDIPLSVQEAREGIPVVVVRAADRTIAFEVEVLHSEQELVLKPLGTEIAHAPYVSGAALLGTGEVVIVLDANDLVRGVSGLPTSRRRIVTPEPESQQQRIRVLVVDDSITTRTLEKNILETAGFDVRVAIDGVEGWSALSEDEFDVVVTDIEMPRMDGLELTRRIKGNPRMQRLPVILLTSLDKPEQQEAGLKAGADAYLVKSRFDQNKLLEVIESFV